MTGWALHQVIQRDPTFCRWAGEYYGDRSVPFASLSGRFAPTGRGVPFVAGRRLTSECS